MAVIVRTRVRVEDAAGVPVSGGKFRVYLANTTTLASLFATADLNPATPLTNPVVAGSDGWCAEIFCASANYDCATLTAADAVIKSEEDVPSLGSDNATLAKDFTNSRFQVEGVAGTVWVEAGDASPDNTGGAGKLSGWNRTQADSWTFDAALTDTTGKLKENGKRLQGVVATAATTLAAATSQVIPLPNDPTGCRRWLIDFFDTTRSAATSIVLTVQLSFDGGSTYKSTAEYDGWLWGRDQGSAAVTENSYSAVAAGTIAAAIRGSANRLAWGTLEILSPLAAGSSDATIIRGDVIGMNQEATNRVTRYLSAIYCQSASQGIPTHLKILASSGNIDLKYRVVPQRGWGET